MGKNCEDCKITGIINATKGQPKGTRAYYVGSKPKSGENCSKCTVRWLPMRPLNKGDVPSGSVRDLYVAALVDAVKGAIWKRVFEIVVSKSEKITVPERHNGMRSRVKEVPTEWSLKSSWKRIQSDVDWINSDNREFNSFLGICSTIDTYPYKIRSYINKYHPVGYYSGHKIIEVSNDLEAIRKTRNRYVDKYSGTDLDDELINLSKVGGVDG